MCKKVAQITKILARFARWNLFLLMFLYLSVDAMQLVNHAVPHEKLFSQALSEMGKDGAHPTPYTTHTVVW